MKKFTIIILFLSCSIVFGQGNETRSVFISGLVGSAQIGTNDLSNETEYALSFGGSFGIPVTKNISLYTRISYASRSGFNSYMNRSGISGNVQLTNQLVQVTSSFSQLLMNAGLLYSITLSDEFNLGITGGVSYSIVNSETELPTGLYITNYDNEGIYGYYGGILLEKSFPDSDFSTFAEAIYNYARSDAIYTSKTFSGMNFMIGVRYYLAERH